MAGRALRRIREWTDEIAARLRSWFDWVWDRVTREPGYVEAVVSLAVAFVELFCRNHAVRRFVYEAAHTLVVVLRDLLRGDDFDEGPAWS